MDLISHQLDAILTFSAYFRFQLFVLMVLLGFHLPSNWHSFHWNECLILTIYPFLCIKIFCTPTLLGQLPLFIRTITPFQVHHLYIYPSLSRHLLKNYDSFTPTYRDIYPKIRVEKSNFWWKVSSKFSLPSQNWHSFLLKWMSYFDKVLTGGQWLCIEIPPILAQHVAHFPSLESTGWFMGSSDIENAPRTFVLLLSP